MTKQNKLDIPITVQTFNMFQTEINGKILNVLDEIKVLNNRTNGLINTCIKLANKLEGFKEVIKEIKKQIPKEQKPIEQ